MNTNSPETIEELISYSKKIALWSFLIGTLILLLFYFTKFTGFIYFALFFILATAFVNTTFLIKLLLSLKKNKKQRKSIFQTMFLMLANIPIGMFYIYLGFEIFSSIYTD